ncbi:MAG: hypothetical protein ACI85Q_001069 [Salibacteraceae bacterium]|jgi:hypothetical protein
MLNMWVYDEVGKEIPRSSMLGLCGVKIREARILNRSVYR